jgi:hypothetical protein
MNRTFVNNFSPPQPQPTWQVLQYQYRQPRLIPVPILEAPAVPAQVNIAAVVTIGSVLVYLLSDNEAVKILALQAFSAGSAAWISQSMN